jgi:galactokinase
VKGRWAAPGRVNVIGEHTDYNGGYVLPIALPHTVVCTAETRTDELVRATSRQHQGRRITVGLAELPTADVRGWERYPLGVVNEYRRRGYVVGGLELELDGDVPVGAGLSSSAAVECSVAIAVRDLFGLTVSDDELIDIARAAENDYVGAPTGILDQSASVLCRAGHALFLDVGTGVREQVPFDLAAAGLALLVVDTHTPHALVDGEYAARRAQCEAAAAALGLHSLREADADLANSLDDPLLRRRARHVATENARVLAVVELLHSGGDLRAIGPILSASHASLRDDFDVSTVQLDAVVEECVKAGAHGARMVGGGFGGSVVALVDTGAVASVSTAVVRRFAAAGFVAPRTFVAVPSDGARRIV